MLIRLRASAHWQKAQKKRQLSASHLCLIRKYTTALCCGVPSTARSGSLGGRRQCRHPPSTRSPSWRVFQFRVKVRPSCHASGAASSPSLASGMPPSYSPASEDGRRPCRRSPSTSPTAGVSPLRCSPGRHTVYHSLDK